MTSDITALQLLVADGRGLLAIMRLSILANLGAAFRYLNANDNSA